jgi:hypothetical protein
LQRKKRVVTLVIGVAGALFTGSVIRDSNGCAADSRLTWIADYTRDSALINLCSQRQKYSQGKSQQKQTLMELTKTAHSRLLMALFCRWSGAADRQADLTGSRRRLSPWETETGRSAEDPDKYILSARRLQAGKQKMNI